MLANIYLYYVFELWADRWRRHHARGSFIIVRYADDSVAGISHESDAKRFLAYLRQRLEQFALSLHPEKTCMIEFGRHAVELRAERGLGKPVTFNFLGLTYISGCPSRITFQLKRITRRARLRTKVQEINDELRWRMHLPIPVKGVESQNKRTLFL